MRREFHVRFCEGAGVRFPRATRLVVLVNHHTLHDWLMTAVPKRLREELGKLGVEINEEKSRTVDLRQGGSFGYLGFDFRRVRSHNGKWRPHYTPKLKKRTELLGKLKQAFRSHRSQPVERVITIINPILRGFVNYFAVGNSGRCFTYIDDWVEKKVRRHLARNAKGTGFGWNRWSTQWLYGRLGLFKEYRVSFTRPRQKALPAGTVA